MEYKELQLKNSIKESILALLNSIYNNDDDTTPKLKFLSLSHQDKYYYLIETLTKIVNNVGCESYLYILLITELVQELDEIAVPILREILDQYVIYPDICFSKDIAFSAYYYLGVYYTRVYDEDSLKKLLCSNDKYIDLFYQKYTLYYELICRYLNMVGYYKRLKVLALCGIKSQEEFGNRSIKERTCKESGYIIPKYNPAIEIGYVVAVASFLESIYISNLLDYKLLENQNKNHVDYLKISVRDIFSKHPKSMFDNNFLLIDEITDAIRYSESAINYNNTYAKYYYLKAKMLFFKEVYITRSRDVKIQKEVDDLLEKAKSLENSKASDYVYRVSEYSLFQQLANGYFFEQYNNKCFDTVIEKKKRNIVSQNECPSHQDRPEINYKDDEEYVFVSYSSLDFKYVYTDLLVYKDEGIKFWYDKDTIPGDKWSQTVREKIEKSSCVICYLSNNFLKSNAIIEELKYIKDLKKDIICVDLTGIKQISKIIISLIQNDSNAKNYINSEKLNLLVNIFNDDVDVIERRKEPKVTAHISRLKSVLIKKYPETIPLILSEHITSINNIILPNGLKRVNEDYYIDNNEYHIYIVADGISRKKDEYKIDGYSISSELTKLFCNEMESLLKSKVSSFSSVLEVKYILKECYKNVNKKIKKFIEENKANYNENNEIPGCVCIVGIIYKNKLIYGSAGDCMGILSRDDQMIVFSQKQTTYAFSLKKVEQDRDLLQKAYVNNKKNEYSYGVVNGNDDNAESFVISHIDLEFGDVLYLASDGISDYIQYSNPKKINELEMTNIMNKSREFDSDIDKPYFDDATMIRIKIGNQ